LHEGALLPTLLCSQQRYYPNITIIWDRSICIWDNDWPKMPLDLSLFYLTGPFDQPHFHAFQCDCWRLELKHGTMMYRNKFLIVCRVAIKYLTSQDICPITFNFGRT
jgi:hypothetical protein